MNLRLGLNLLGLAAVAVTSCTGKVTREVAATILTQGGTVSIERSNAGEARSVAEQSRLARGDVLRTGVDGEAALMLLPGALVQLGPNSHFLLRTLFLEKDGNASDAAMSRWIGAQLLLGTADIVIQFESAAGKWQIDTPHGVLISRVPGTCRLSVSPERTRVTCLRGAFVFLATGEVAASEIEAGCFRDWPSPAATLFDVADDAQAQDDAELSLSAERNLLQLQDSRTNDPLPLATTLRA